MYQGDSNFATSTSAALTQTVRFPTTTTLSSSVNPSDPGQAVTFTATVAPNPPGSGTPTGTVTFSVDGAPAGTGSLTAVAGVDEATFTTSSLLPGVHSVTAAYRGDGGFVPSTTSTALSQT